MHLYLLLAWCAFLFGYGLDSGTLYRTEALRAVIGREALRGAWLTPTLYGEPFLTKPPGMYVAIAAASSPLGEVTTISSRIPSAIAATGIVLLFFAALRRVVEPRLALAGAMLLPVSLLWLDKAPSAEIDMVQTAWVAGAIFCFLRTLDANARSRTLWWLLALLCVTGGFLTKWTAPAFFYLTAGSMLLWRGQLRELFGWRHLLAAGVGVSLVAWWACAVADRAGWSTLIGTVHAEGSQRFGPKHRGQGYPWLETAAFPLVVLASNLPWALLALVTFRPRFFRLWNEDGRRLLQLLHCWTWPNLLFWSLPAQHHVRYCMPMCPGWIGLGIMACLAWARQPAGARMFRNVSPRAALICALLAWSIVKIVHVELVMPNRTRHGFAMSIARELDRLVPPGETLRVGMLKDEGLIFYYNRPVRRINLEAIMESPRLGDGPVHALLIASEYERWGAVGRFEVVGWLRDQQGDPIVVVRIT